ncbi:MAG: RNA polymerase sigma factor [Myxococcota bacterium]|nr:RNA polymerase sigma factor [Myxococcota bacterium]
MHVHAPRQAPPAGTLVDDLELVDRLRRRDPDAYRLLYTRHARYVAGVVFRLLGGDHDLDDIVQDSFVDAVEGIAGLEDGARLRSWLVTIAIRKVNRVLAARHRRKRLVAGLALLAPSWFSPTGERSVLELQRALDRLPPKLRVPWILGRVEDLELVEVARACSTSIATTKRRIAAADQRLRRWFDA